MFRGRKYFFKENSQNFYLSQWCSFMRSPKHVGGKLTFGRLDTGDRSSLPPSLSFFSCHERVRFPLKKGASSPSSLCTVAMETNVKCIRQGPAHYLFSRGKKKKKSRDIRSPSCAVFCNFCLEPLFIYSVIIDI